MTADAHRILRDWDVPLGRVSETGTALDRSASGAELAALAEELSVDTLDSLRFVGALAPAPHRPGDVELRGRLTAEVGQTCSVTLEPMTTRIDEAVLVRFTAHMPTAEDSSEDDELPILEQEDVDVFENGRLPVGRIVYETLASAIDPYPRKADEETGAWTAGGDPGDAAADHPFAALSRLKKAPSSED